MSGSVDLFQLLPAAIRARDANVGGPLQNLFAILQDQHDAVDSDIAALYENWFIETCAEWVVPYIGDLLGVPPLNTAAIAGVTARAYVAHTLSYRRRKGTPIVLQQLAQDVTNWPARAVEFFQLLATTQYMNHPRPANLATPDLRDPGPLQLLGGAFDPFSHTVDVRSVVGPAIDPALAPGGVNDNILLRGKYNLPNIGIFLWRLKSYAIENVTPSVVADATNTRYRCHPAGLDMPLYNQPPPPAAAFIPVTGEAAVPGPLRRLALYEELEARRQAMVDQQMVWLANSTAFALGSEIVDSNGNTQRVVAVPAGGKTGAAQPPWATTLLANTGDGDLTWQMAAFGAALPATYFDAMPVLQIFPQAGGPAIPPEQIMICDLDDLPPPAAAGTWRTVAASKTYTRNPDGAQISLPIQAALDPQTGRLAFAAPPPAGPGQTRVSVSTAFSGDIGGGPYNRTASVQAMLAGIDPQASSYWQVAVSQSTPPVAGKVFADLTGAVDAWNALPAATQRFGVIAVLDNASYAGDLTGTHLVRIPEGGTLVIVCADWPSLGTPGLFQLSPVARRAFLKGTIGVQGAAPATSENPGSLIISGLLIEGSVLLSEGNLGTLSLSDCTLIPPAGQLGVAAAVPGASPNAGTTISLARTICGPIVLPAAQFAGLTLSITDSIVDAAGGVAIAAPTADAAIQASTILGSVGANASGLRSLSASNSVFTASVTVERTQGGCVRYSVLPTDTSKVAQRFHCQPDLALANVAAADQAAVRERLTPVFTSAAFGDPGYAQLSSACAQEIRAGADDGSEMGAFDFLKQPQRDANLRAALPDYLRFGMQAGIFYVN